MPHDDTSEYYVRLMLLGFFVIVGAACLGIIVATHVSRPSHTGAQTPQSTGN